jgi:hypothetical protein
VNEAQKKIAEMTEAERWRLLSWLAVHHPAAVLAGLNRRGAEPLANAAIGWKVSEPEPDPESAG